MSGLRSGLARVVGGLGLLALVAAVVAVVVAGTGRGPAVVPTAGAADVSPNRSLQAGHGGQFIAVCPFSHTAPDDPIVHAGMPGMSHQHEFFGNTGTDARSTFSSLVGAASTCSDAGDHSAYWVPSLFVDDARVQPRRVDAYYRVAAGVDPASVRPFPEGLKALAGDQRSLSAQPLGVVAWSCGLSPRLSSEPPDDCGSDRPLQLRLTFPACWDGEHVDTADHRAHLAYPTSRGCPASHPVALPQLTLVVHYPRWGKLGSVRLASGDVHTAHGDFFDGWRPERLRDQVMCLNRQVTCTIAGGTFHTGQGAGDDDDYNLPGTGDGY